MRQETSTIDPSLLVAQSGWVRSLANHLVRDPDGAEDVAQETLLAALASPPQDAADAQRLRAWLGRVAFNLAHLSRRRNSRRRAREERAARGEREDSAADAVVNGSIEGLVLEAVRALDEPYRTTVHLRYFEGLSTSEVAQQTHTTNSAVRKRLWRARGKLRQELDSKHNGERHAWFRALAPLAGIRPGDPGGLAVPATAPVATGLAWKAAAALPLLALGVWSGRALLAGPADGARQVATAPMTTSPAALLASERVPVRLESSPGVSDGGPALERDERNGPRVRVDLLGVDSAPPKRESIPAVPVSGHVVDLWGNPLGSVELVDPRAAGVVLGTTGVNGAFALEALELPVTLQIRSPGYTTVHGARIEPGEGAWPRWIVAAPAVALAGHVVDETGQAVQGARVEVVYDEAAFVELPVLVDVSDALPPRMTTDVLGAFALDGVPSGAGISLRVEHPGYRVDLRPVPALSELAFLLRLVPRTDLLPVAGVVLDEQNRPIVGVDVALGDAATTTDETGAFSMQVEAQTRSTITARKEGYLPTCLECDQRGGLRVRVRMVMRAANQAVLGQVLDEEGRPLAGWLVFAAPPAADTPLATTTDPADMSSAMPTVRTDAEGGFRIGGLGEREYALFGVDPETLLVTESCEVRGGARGVELRALTAEVAEVLPGRVLSRDGAPVSDAVVWAELSIATGRGTFLATSAVARTDSRGNFALSRVAARNVRLRIDHPFARDAQSLLSARTTRPGETPEFIADLLRPVRFSGPADAVSVLDAAGHALALEGFTGQRTLAQLVRGRSPVLAVGSAACTVVWYRGGVEIGRDQVSIHAGSLDPGSRPLAIGRPGRGD